MKRVLIALIRFYRKRISPLKAPCCRFTPTCSQYAITAIERFGAIKGTGMAIWRVLRCAPWHPGGYDPVPEKKSKNKHNKCCSKKLEDETENNDLNADIFTSTTCGDNDVNDESTTETE